MATGIAVVREARKSQGRLRSERTKNNGVGVREISGWSKFELACKVKYDLVTMKSSWCIIQTLTSFLVDVLCLKPLGIESSIKCPDESLTVLISISTASFLIEILSVSTLDLLLKNGNGDSGSRLSAFPETFPVSLSLEFELLDPSVDLGLDMGVPNVLDNDRCESSARATTTAGISDLFDCIRRCDSRNYNDNADCVSCWTRHRSSLPLTGPIVAVDDNGEDDGGDDVDLV